MPKLMMSAETVRLLHAAEVDPHLARVLAYIEKELSDRLRSDAEDDPAVAVQERTARRLRLLRRMAARYEPAANRGRLSNGNAGLMLAALARLACPVRLRHL